MPHVREVSKGVSWSLRQNNYTKLQILSVIGCQISFEIKRYQSGVLYLKNRLEIHGYLTFIMLILIRILSNSTPHRVMTLSKPCVCHSVTLHHGFTRGQATSLLTLLDGDKAENHKFLPKKIPSN